MHRAVLAPLAAHAPGQLRAWREAFAAEIAPRLPGAMRDIVDAHQANGDLCAVVTATSRFVAEPFARAFGIDFGESWFYSDSASDLPLLQAVTHPVAVRPDARLRAHAQAAGWPVHDTLRA